MKKNLFYLFALICSMSLFTACSDDDDETWKKIPQTEISGGDATLNINGTPSTTGSVTMTVKNESEATLALSNVIPGYPKLNVDVELQKQADNSYKFAGASQVNTAPTTRLASSEPAILSVEVDGTITLDGKVSLNVTANGPGLFVGTYTDAQLNLKYGGSELVGKTVYYTIENSTPVLTLVYVVPGEEATAIPGVYTGKDGAFSGEVTTSTGAKVAYSGSITAASGLTLNVDVALSANAQAGLTATWPLSHTLLNEDGGVSNYAPVRLVWDVDDASPFAPQQLSMILSFFASAPLAEVLKDVTLSADGNLVATYYSKIEPYYFYEGEWVECEAAEIFGMELPAEGMWLMTVGLSPLPINPYERDWNTSPKNLVHWYAKDGNIYLVPNIAQIMKQLVVDQKIDQETLNTINGVMALLPTIGSMDDTSLQNLAQGAIGKILENMGISNIDLTALDAKLIRQVLGWLTEGIPLKYKMEDGSLFLHVDKEMADPFMKVIIPMLPLLEQKLAELVPADMLPLIYMMFLGTDSLVTMGDAYNNNTTTFELGLNFLHE